MTRYPGKVLAVYIAYRGHETLGTQFTGGSKTITLLAVLPIQLFFLSFVLSALIIENHFELKLVERVGVKN
jgi:hypothetical protein